MDTVLESGLGRFKLQRLPSRNNEQLRAWDAADEYLLQYLYEKELVLSDRHILILNDQFGALATALNAYKPVAISDSFISRQATKLNADVNGLPVDNVCLRNSLDWPEHKMDLVLIKIPKTLAYLEDQLIRLQRLLTEKSTVIAAGMVKHMPSSVWKLIEKYLGPTKPSLAKKKARLIFIDVHVSNQVAENPYPVYYPLENSTYLICNHANVFSRDSLDIGTRFLLAHLPKDNNYKGVVDLGCGNGVVGLTLAQQNPQSMLYFVDESYMAVASAEENFRHAFNEREAEFLVTDGLSEFESESIDLIVCNPPFHQQNTVGDQIAQSMFKQSRRVLRQGGELRVIGNRHLAYHMQLKSLFTECKTVASNAKFVIWKVKK